VSPHTVDEHDSENDFGNVSNYLFNTYIKYKMRFMVRHDGWVCDYILHRGYTGQRGAGRSLARSRLLDV